MKILVEMSARHVHLTQEAVEILFGKGATLTEKRELSQPGQYLCEERVELVGPKKSIGNVSVLGPTRPENQLLTPAQASEIPCLIFATISEPLPRNRKRLFRSTPCNDVLLGKG